MPDMRSALILDEVYTGFRLVPRSAQEFFDVRADMVVYGKTVAGGMPIGVVCGTSGVKSSDFWNYWSGWMRSHAKGPNAFEPAGAFARGVMVRRSHSSGSVLPCTTTRWKFGTSYPGWLSHASWV